jgi:hypothetical protein
MIGLCIFTAYLVYGLAFVLDMSGIAESAVWKLYRGRNVAEKLSFIFD